MKRFTKSKKVLFGLATSLVLALAIGSFALGETQTPVTPQTVEPQSVTAGAFTITGESITENTDYMFSGTSGTDGWLTIMSNKEMTIQNTDPATSTTDRIEVTREANITLAGVNIDRSGEKETSPKAALTIIKNATFNVNIALAENSNNTLTGEAGDELASSVVIGSPGIEKSDDGSIGIDQLGKLTIKGTGQLTATGGLESAGIGGGGNSEDGSKITISGGTITANGGEYGAGIGGGCAGDGSEITISDNAVITAKVGVGGAGIGGGFEGSGSDITISGGTITAIGGCSKECGAAGIGGGYRGNGSNITISGGVVNANGGYGGAGIGGGIGGNGTGITISGGSITATGGYAEVGSRKYSGAGIGSGANKTGSNNKLNGNAVVLAISGENSATGGVKPQLDGFVDGQGDSLITQGIAFTGVGEYEFVPDPDSDVPDAGTWVLKSTTWTESEMYDDVVLSKNLEIPIDLTIPAGQTLSIEKDKTVALSVKDNAKYTVEGTLQNNGTLTLPNSLEVKGNGKITTLLNYDPQGGSIKTNDDNYITYQDADSIKKYESLPEATKEGYDLEGWYTKEKGQGTKVETTDDVLLNQHTLYANWVESEPPTPPTPTPPGPEPTPTPPEPGPEPTPTPEPTPDPSVDPEDGSGSGSSSSKTSDPFMGGAALALLGVATTGAVLVRKRK